MDNPFFRNQWSQSSRPFYSPAIGGIPIQRKSISTTSSPKVVSIPVRFVDSETKLGTNRSASALKIQKVFRSFVVRKSVKKIAAVRSEVDEIERRISRSEIAELIRRDEKERLKVNETLMALLFKLDSVRGVDSGVRDCRKAVIKKVIALQEKLDNIVAPANPTLGTTEEDKERVDRVVEVVYSDSPAESVDQTLEITDSFENVADQTHSKALNATDSANVTVECCDRKETLETDGNTNCLDNAIDRAIELGFHDESEPNADRSKSGKCEKMEVMEVGVDIEVKADEEACDVKEIVENRCITPFVNEYFEERGEMSPTDSWSEYSTNTHSLVEGGEENITSRKEDGVEVQNADMMEDNTKQCLVAGGKDDNMRNRELLEKMMEDNEKMLGLMTQLFERNEMQTRMLNSLTHRVEQLEKAFMCDRLRRKKKRNA